MMSIEFESELYRGKLGVMVNTTEQVDYFERFYCALYGDVSLTWRDDKWRVVGVFDGHVQVLTVGRGEQGWFVHFYTPMDFFAFGSSDVVSFEVFRVTAERIIGELNLNV